MNQEAPELALLRFGERYKDGNEMADVSSPEGLLATRAPKDMSVVPSKGCELTIGHNKDSK